MHGVLGGLGGGYEDGGIERRGWRVKGLRHLTYHLDSRRAP